MKNGEKKKIPPAVHPFPFGSVFKFVPKLSKIIIICHWKMGMNVFVSFTIVDMEIRSNV